MTSRELILNAIRFNEVPRIPVAVLDGITWMLRGFDMSYAELFEMDAHAAAEKLVNRYNEIGSDILYANAGASSAVHETLGGKADFSRKGLPVAPIRRALKSLIELETLDPDDVFKKVVEHPYFDAVGKQLEAMAEINGDEKLIMAFSGGPLTNAAGFAGVEELMMALADDSDVAEKALTFSHRMILNLIRYQVEHGANAISLADPVASVNVISGAMFDEYFMPWFKRLIADLKSFDLPIMLHICGNTTSRLVPLIGTGIDIFSVDEVDLGEALKVARGNYAIFGNLSTLEVIQKMSSEAVYSTAKERCTIAGKSGGFILAPGCDLPADAPAASVEAMFRAAREF
ncbi:MAG: hypothetical protein HUJ65_04070 [Oscillospiraceae bacterium]|nr:hypothetical protein [Oscillospiraceae bacterium]